MGTGETVLMVAGKAVLVACESELVAEELSWWLENLLDGWRLGREVL